MAKRTPITVDLGDEIDRPIRFSGAYVESLKAKYGSLREMMGKIDEESGALYKFLLDGLIDKAGFTEESIREAVDASLQTELWLKLLEALTGNKADPPNKRTIDPNLPSQTVQ